MKSHRFREKISRWRALAMPVALQLGRPLVWLRRRLKPHKTFFYKVESAMEGEEGLTILCGLKGPSRQFFLGRAFTTESKQVEIGKVKLMDVFRPDWKRRSEGALIVTEVNQLHYDWLKQPGWFFIPVWIAGEVSLPIPEEFLKRETVKSDLRKIRRQQYAYEITHDEARFNEFYHHMHLPYIRKTHGEEACLDSYAEKRQQCSNCDLLLVHKKDQPGRDIAGMLIIHEEGGSRLWSLGVRDDGVDHVQDGVLAALYHFSFEFMARAGHSRLSLGNSRPLLHDGVLNFKRKLSHTLRHPSWQGMAFKITSLTVGVKNFLQKNPFIFFDNGRLRGAVFVDGELTGERLLQIGKSYLYPGLERVVVFTLQTNQSLKVEELAPSLIGQLEIRSAASLLNESNERLGEGRKTSSKMLAARM